MGPKRTDNVSRVTKLSQSSLLGGIGGGTAGEQECQQCVGKFSADFELCCRESSPAYPVPIAVYIRGYPPAPSQVQSNSSQHQQSGTHSGTSVTPSLAGGMAEEQFSAVGKKTSRARIPSIGHSGILIGVTGTESDSRSHSTIGQEPSKASSTAYKTFQLLRDSDFFRPKLLVDSVGSETEPIDQITALYMRAWRLDQQLIEILKKVFPLQEQLHTLNLCYVGLNDQTISGVVALCQVTKNLKTVSLDGNPLAVASFHLLIDKDDTKITHLSLRFCQITDPDVKRLANAIGNISTQNWKLLTLNLSGNQIGDDGAEFIATALRYNRTLISLNLSSNSITDQGAFHLALVLRRIVLTPEEIIRRRYLLAERYNEAHPDDLRNNASSPTPSNVSTKSKSGRDSRTDWKRLTDPSKRKQNPSKIAQVVVDKRNRAESDENRPPSENRGDSKRGRNEGSGGRSAALNPPSAGGSSSRRTAANPSNTTGKDSDAPRTSGAARVKKIAAAVNATSKKNISIVKEEDEDASGEEALDYLRILFDVVGRSADISFSKKLVSLQIHPIDHENPLLETNEIESQHGEIWLKGNFVLLSLNLSRNYLTTETVKEFVLSIQQQSALTNFNEAFSLSSSSTALADFSGLCRLELQGMVDISSKSSDYQSLETLLTQKNPSNRFQQIKERETRELHDPQSLQPSQQLQLSMSDKATSVAEKTRGGSSMRSTAQRPTSRLKD